VDPTGIKLDLAEPHEIGAKVPGPLSGRLDALVEVAEAAGERTNRKELLAALILAAPASGKELARLLKRYRKATVGEALVRGASRDAVLNPTRSRGPRPRRSRNE
jgi:hypothetical protein